MRHRKWVILGLVTALVLLVVICVCFPTILWVGSTNLVVVFVVFDGDTKVRISGAEVEFGSFGHDEGYSGEVRLTTDGVGIAMHSFDGVRTIWRPRMERDVRR